MSDEIKRKIILRSAESLKPHPLQPKYFRDANDAELDALAADMLENGQLTPVEILPDGTIICGHQRVRGCERNNVKVRCWVRNDLGKLGDAAVEQRFIQDNLHRRQLSDLEVARCYVRLRELHRQLGSSDKPKGDVRDVVGKILGKSGRQLDRLVKLLGTPPEVQRAFESGQLSLEQASRVANVDSEKRAGIAKRIKAGDIPRVVVEKMAPPKPARIDPIARNLGELRRTMKRQLELFESLDLKVLQSKLKGSDAKLFDKYATWLGRVTNRATGA